jgi:tetratricopeptide (TPR) repeat protein
MLIAKCPYFLEHRIPERAASKYLPEVSHRLFFLGHGRNDFDGLKRASSLQSVTAARLAVFASSFWEFSAACLFLACFSGALIGADSPKIDVSMSADEIFVGEFVDFQVEIKNVEDPQKPDVSALQEMFDVVSGGDQSQNQSSTFIINGRVTHKNEFSHIYLYRLTPKVSGKLTIPAIRAIVDGKELKSNPIELLVREEEKQDLVLVEIKSDREKVYPTQSFTVTLRVHVQPLPERGVDPLKPLRRQPPNLNLNWLDVPAGLTSIEASQWLQPLVSNDGTGFTINEISASSGSLFGRSRAAVFDLVKGREKRIGIDGGAIDYFVYELSRTFAAEKPGLYTFGPTVVKGAFVTGSKGQEYSARRLVATAKAFNVEVREVPSPRPATYTGGIGEYRVESSASPTKLRVGDPMTLTLEYIRGKDAGGLELISAPDLLAIPEIADDFDIIDKAPTGRVEGNTKKFSFAMRPKRPGLAVPALKLATFDPTTEKFVEVATKSIALEVTEASRLTGGELVGSVSAPTNKGIQRSTAGIFQNITVPSELRDERIDVTWWMMMVAGTWGVAGCVAAAVVLGRRRSNDTVAMRRSKARREAMARLTEAAQLLSVGKEKDSLRKIRSAFVGLVADTQNRVTGGITTSDVENALCEVAVVESDRTATRALLQSIENAEYGAGDVINATEAIKTARSLIDRISPLLERKVIPLFLLVFAIAQSTYAIASESRERVLSNAQAMFDNAKTPDDYRASAQEFEKAVVGGFQNGAVFYNIGNAYFQAGEYGRAIINYRKAKQFRPRDSYLEANLQQAIAMAPGRLAAVPKPWWNHVLFWTEWFSIPQKVKLTACGLIAAACLLVIATLLERSRLNLLVGVVFSFALMVGIDTAINNPWSVKRAAITGETIARKGIGKDYEPAFDQPLRDGAEFTVLNQTNDWTFGHFEGVGDGWVRNEFVAR